MSEARKMELHLSDGTIESLDGAVLDEVSSREIFQRPGQIVRIEVSLNPGLEG